MNSLTIRDLCLSYGTLKVLDGLNMDIPSGSITAVIGPSGCGKTSLLNILAGLNRQSKGTVQGLGSRPCSYCFQEPRLLPWMSARDNILFALSRFPDRKESEARADEALRRTGLLQFADKSPTLFSGGMRRRLSLARAFAYPSDVLLLDEAFSSVDLKQRIELLDLFQELWSREPRTSILVTHEVQDALYVADQVVVLSERPARVLECVEVKNPREERKYGSQGLLSLEERLYSLILS